MLGKIVFSLIFVIIVPLGIWHLYLGLNDVLEASQSADWPTTTGKIISSAVVRSTSSGRHHGTSYAPQISYSYSVEDHPYVGTVIAPGRFWGYASSHQAVRQFAAGNSPTISYSPSDPAKSVLVPGLHAVNFAKFLMGLMVCTFASVFGVVGLKASRGLTDRAGAMTMPQGSVASRLALFLALTAFAEVGLLIYLST